MKVGKVIIFVHDMQKMFKFYSALAQDPPENPVQYSEHWNEIAFPGCRLALHGGRGEQGSTSMKIAFEVDELEAAIQRLDAIGVTHSEIRSPVAGVRVVDFLDPEGNRISIEDFR